MHELSTLVDNNHDFPFHIFINHLRTDDEILIKIFISTMADDEILIKISISTMAVDKILVIRSTYI